MNPKEITNSLLGSTLGRLLLFGVLTFMGFKIGTLTPTALPYQDHHPIWDTLGSSAIWFLIAAGIPMAIVIRATSLKWFAVGIILASSLAFLSGWGFRYIFTK